MKEETCTIIFQDKEFEVVDTGINTIEGKLDFGWEYVNLLPGPRRFGWFSEHTSSEGVLKSCWKQASVVRYLQPHIEKHEIS
jgi:hypothetical protein